MHARSLFADRSAVAAILAMALPLLVGLGAEAAEFGACGIETTAPKEVVEALDRILSLAVDPDSTEAKAVGYAPGAVLSVKAPGWRYAKSIGVADPDTGKPVDCRMPFQIGSNTKMMTATVLLQLQEEKALSLDDPLASHLPEIAAQLPNGDAMTLRQLAQHTAGVFSYTDDAPDGTPGIMKSDTTDRRALVAGYTPKQLVQFVIDHGGPSFAPGAPAAWAYSNTGYVLLGMIIEEIEGKPLADVLMIRIFEPLGMADTFLWNDVPRHDFGLARTYFKAPFEYETTDWNMSQGWAAGAVISTVDDIHRFIEALVTGDLFKSPKTLAEMQDTMPTGSLTVPQYGIGLAEKIPGLWGHGGQTLGVESDVAAFNQNGLSIVGWASSANNIMVLGTAVVADALRQLEPEAK